MKVIWFANKFYTLWDVTSRVVESRYCKDTLITQTYIKNISKDIEKVKNFYPDVKINESLRGHNCKFFYTRERKEIDADKFIFGKYAGKLISECNDADYLCWLFDICEGERKKNIRARLVELGFSVEDGIT